MRTNIFQRLKAVPPIVRIIITQATRHRAQGTLTDTVFEEQIRRVAREELEPKGLTLLARDLPGGRTRFIIKEQATGAVCDLLDFAADGSLESDSSEAFAEASQESESAPA